MWRIIYVKFNAYRLGPNSHLNRSRGGRGSKSPPSILAPVTDKDIKIFFWWFMRIVRENYSSSHSGQTSP